MMTVSLSTTIGLRFREIVRNVSQTQESYKTRTIQYRVRKTVERRKVTTHLKGPQL